MRGVLTTILVTACVLQLVLAAGEVSKETYGERSGFVKNVRGRKQLSSKRTGGGPWTVKNGEFFDASGNLIRFSGVSWSGFEAQNFPDGLQVRNISSHMRQMKSLGFNMIRLPFQYSTLQPGQLPRNPWLVYAANPDLQGFTTLQIMDAVIKQAAKLNIAVILDYHMLGNQALWFDTSAGITAQNWTDGWVMLAKRYKNYHIVKGADLLNEPHPSPALPSGKDPVWANASYHPKYNFRTACIAAAQAIQAVNKDWIIFIEGMWMSSWEGENLIPATRFPMPPLPVPGKLAYSAHDYGPNLYPQGYFFESSFPNNLNARWQKLFGHVISKKQFPVWIGEFGGPYKQSGETYAKQQDVWLEYFTAYIKAQKLSWTWWTWVAWYDSTGSILSANDYKTPDADKMAVLQPLMYPNFQLPA